MKGVELCGLRSRPMVKQYGDRVEIGEVENLCMLSKSEWETMKQKILNGMI
jgi:hypothetical protein